MTKAPKFDVVHQEDEGRGNCPSFMRWCTRCKSYETVYGKGDSCHVPERKAPISWEFWTALGKHYKNKESAYHLWTRDGKPTI